MADRDIYSAEQLEKIRATLKSTLGEGSAQALANLDTRFTAAESSEAAQAKKSPRKVEEPAKEAAAAVDIAAVIQEGSIKRLLETLGEVKEDPAGTRSLVAALLQHNEVKAFHMVEALGKVSQDRELVDALVHGIVTRKGVNPLIDALRFAVISPEAMKSLAMAIAEQGTVNHIIRSIATAPRNQEAAEIIWAMEVMGKGTMEQMLESLNLMEATSPGVVILATGVVNRKEVAIEPLVRALGSVKGNSKAESILAVELSRQADIPALITLLEKYVSDRTEAGEILVTKLVHRSLESRGRVKLLAKAAGNMRSDSSASKILAWGIIEQGDDAQLERAYPKMNAAPEARSILGLGISKKLGKIKALKLLGKDFFTASKASAQIEANLSAARKRYHWILKEVLGESLEEKKPASAREGLMKDLKE
ncbi:MAG: hypothetical protein HQL59_02115 [Magnetococcales bacterium]|nr:hypothetical protein [Magnetococcales bacterium]